MTSRDSVLETGEEAAAGDNRRIVIHVADNFESMRRAGKLAAETLDFITPEVGPGVTTERLDRRCHDFIVEHGAVPAPLGYRGFPKSICTSINHVVCHGIPSDRKVLRDGDIVNIDITVILDGWHGDTSRMFFIGKPGVKARRLVEITYESMMRGIDVVKPGATLGDIGAAIQDHAEAQRFSVVRDFCGHGLGQIFHDAPNVMHYGNAGQGDVLREGMFFTIEPMINEGVPDAVVQDDGWTALTLDGSLSAQYEHTLEVTPDGVRVLTVQIDAGHWEPPGRWYPQGWPEAQTTG